MKITAPFLLFVVFLVLKLTNVIAWSWWWVSAPLWATSLLWFIVHFCIEMKKQMETPEQKAARQLRELARRLQR